LVSANNRVDRDQSIKHQLKILRWYARRIRATARWGQNTLSKSPAVLGNAMPKSGSHLIIQVLQGLTKMGPFVNPGFPPVNRTEDNRHLSNEGVLAGIARMKPGDIGYGYVKATRPFIQALTRPGMASIFVYRDPRDMIISHIFYATDMYQDHGMHRYYNEELSTMEERINAAIGGVTEEGTHLKSVKDRYMGYKGWLEQPEVLCLRFEDLILNQEKTLDKLLNYLEEKGFQSKVSRESAIRTLASAVAPKKSGTFRKGKPGSWKEYFTERNIKYFKGLTGDLLVNLGYEQDTNW
jgi:hypothetical protein